MLAPELAALALDLSRNAAEPSRVRAIAGLLGALASTLADHEASEIPPHLREPERAPSAFPSLPAMYLRGPPS